VGAQGVLEGVFREYGLPESILTDNGSPFSSRALGGLSRLSVWWIKLGIEPLLIEPGHPEQNGGHERMHRTLKADTARPPARDLRAQQRRFDAFQAYFNEERPHEALGQRPPAELYTPSAREYPEHLDELEYPGHYERRRVRTDGQIRWQGRGLFVSEALIGEWVGLEETDDGVWDLYFGPVALGRFEERNRRLQGVRRYESLRAQEEEKAARADAEHAPTPGRCAPSPGPRPADRRARKKTKGRKAKGRKAGR
jgi:hypothetical protein